MTSGDSIRHRDSDPAIPYPSSGSTEPADGDELATLRHRSQRLSALLSALDPPEDEVRRSAAAIRPRLARRHGRRSAATRFPPALRVAAVIVVLVGGGLAVQPARAWVLDRLRAAVEAISGPGAAPEAVDRGVPVGAAPGSDLEVTVPVVGDSLFLEVIGGSGELVIRRAADAVARMRMRGAPDATLAVLSTAVRIGGGPTGAAVFELEVPAIVAVVIVTRADGNRSSYVVEPTGRELRVPLAQP